MENNFENWRKFERVSPNNGKEIIRKNKKMLLYEVQKIFERIKCKLCRPSGKYLKKVVVANIKRVKSFRILRTLPSDKEIIRLPTLNIIKRNV